MCLEKLSRELRGIAVGSNRSRDLEKPVRERERESCGICAGKRERERAKASGYSSRKL